MPLSVLDYFFLFTINSISSMMKSIFSNQIALSIWWWRHVAKTLTEYFRYLPLISLFSFLLPSFFSLSISLVFFNSFHFISLFTAFNYSGGYFNPVLATALKWGCSGYSNVDHIIVYWIGACVGAVLSVPLYKYDVIKKLVGKGSLATLKPKAD